MRGGGFLSPLANKKPEGLKTQANMKGFDLIKCKNHYYN